MKVVHTRAKHEFVATIRRRELKARWLAMNLVTYDLVVTNSKNGQQDEVQNNVRDKI